MTALDSIPENKNFLSPFLFKFQVRKMPNVNFFLQSVNIPGVSLPNVQSGNPFVSIPYGGDHVLYEELNIVFKVDEDMENWKELYNWIKGVGFPNRFSEHKELKDKPPTSGEGLISDISLLVLTSSRNPNYDLVFHEAFPISLSQIMFDTRNPDIQFITASATFKYRSYELNAV